MVMSVAVGTGSTLHPRHLRSSTQHRRSTTVIRQVTRVRKSSTVRQTTRIGEPATAVRVSTIERILRHSRRRRSLLLRHTKIGSRYDEKFRWRRLSLSLAPAPAPALGFKNDEFRAVGNDGRRGDRLATGQAENAAVDENDLLHRFVDGERFRIGRVVDVGDVGPFAEETEFLSR